MHETHIASTVMPSTLNFVCRSPAAWLSFPVLFAMRLGNRLLAFSRPMIQASRSFEHADMVNLCQQGKVHEMKIEIANDISFIDLSILLPRSQQINFI
jgi:hypothetical protein